MRKHNKILCAAEEQLAFGHRLSDVFRARNNLWQVIPACDLLELLDAKIRRLGGAGPKGVSVWGA
jgi:ABC-type transport system involved in cytochrome c biogenesis ATPase subunit